MTIKELYNSLKPGETIEIRVTKMLSGEIGEVAILKRSEDSQTINNAKQLSIAESKLKRMLGLKFEEDKETRQTSIPIDEPIKLRHPIDDNRKYIKDKEIIASSEDVKAGEIKYDSCAIKIKSRSAEQDILNPPRWNNVDVEFSEDLKQVTISQPNVMYLNNEASPHGNSDVPAAKEVVKKERKKKEKEDSPKQRAKMLVIVGDSHMRFKQYENALSAYEKAISLDSENKKAIAGIENSRRWIELVSKMNEISDEEIEDAINVDNLLNGSTESFMNELEVPEIEDDLDFEIPIL